jgi:hypothetical protein
MHLYLTSHDFNLSPLLATWLASEGAIAVMLGHLFYASWFFTMVLTSLTASMAVNALVTGLIVYKILRVILAVKPTSVERILGSSTKDTKLQYIIYMIIESGMALFAIQLVRVVLTSLIIVMDMESPAYANVAYTLDFVIGIHEMLNVITRSIHFYFFCFTDVYLAGLRALHQP